MLRSWLSSHRDVRAMLPSLQSSCIRRRITVMLRSRQRSYEDVAVIIRSLPRIYTDVSFKLRLPGNDFAKCGNTGTWTQRREHREANIGTWSHLLLTETIHQSLWSFQTLNQLVIKSVHYGSEYDSLWLPTKSMYVRPSSCQLTLLLALKTSSEFHFQIRIQNCNSHTVTK